MELIKSLENIINLLSTNGGELPNDFDQDKISKEIETKIQSLKSDDSKVIESLFDELLSIQHYLAIVSFKYNIKLNEYLNKFIKHFDRIDDEKTRTLITIWLIKELPWDLADALYELGSKDINGEFISIEHKAPDPLGEGKVFKFMMDARKHIYFEDSNGKLVEVPLHKDI